MNNQSFPRVRKPISQLMALSQECWLRLVSYFKDTQKAQYWLDNVHPVLGIPPKLLLQRSKANDLLQLIINEFYPEPEQND